MEITVTAEGKVSYSINAEGGEAVTGTISDRTDKSFSFIVFNGTAADSSKTVSVKNITVTAL